jgi:hypothetical protein
MASVLGGFFGRLNEHRRLENVCVNIPRDAGPFTARRFRIQIFDPPCIDGRTGRVSAVVDAWFGHMEYMLLPQYREYWASIGIPAPTEREDLVPGRVAETEFDICGCIREIGGCDPEDAANALPIVPSVDGESFRVTLTVTIGYLDPGTPVTGMIALDDVTRPHAADAEPANEAAQA